MKAKNQILKIKGYFICFCMIVIAVIYLLLLGIRLYMWGH